MWRFLGNHSGPLGTTWEAMMVHDAPSWPSWTMFEAILGHLGLKSRWDTTQDWTCPGTGGTGRRPHGLLFERKFSGKTSSTLNLGTPCTLWLRATGGGGSKTPTANHRRPLPFTDRRLWLFAERPEVVNIGKHTGFRMVIVPQWLWRTADRKLG